MDRLIYTAMTGAKHTLEQQATTSHNLANATTTGFREQIDQFRAVPVQGAILPTRAFVVDSTTGSNFASGAIQHTGRELDVAIQGEGWLAVQAADGSEAYTRNGSLKMDENGLLLTRDGLSVQSDSGPLSIPPGRNLAVAVDGTISQLPDGSQPTGLTTIGRLKLVNPPAADLVRGDDGLFRLKSGEPAAADPGVSLISGALETSNVNVVDAMVNMISLARQFDMQIKLLERAESNDSKASQLLAAN
ncbi:MAG TPA: flagellar basal body rod protein FlgF [Thiobacillus sp.]|nr:MAG: flagellar biosynthesis protein FlgF [Hydrogenophilales bacterium 28-61-11]OYZ57768.1 MAG: flagellar biosynthesis protein FlgF [Hydrogenophilales bacterium 16-61-112]OZA42606.1 MAG: flagellar biosynthesis protein FlgF [Hydrogenophilales bacterium 17-61-76]HQT31285.1 flagellar basal body rod protein FlgF [Thiobacillus sp.]HQT69860.1 flagellar basal body rod protein FlgF [Thiobacillus sp.]